MVLDHFLNDELQEGFREFRIEISILRQGFKPRDLPGFTVRIGRGKAVFRLEAADRLSVLEALTQSIDKDRVQPVDGSAVLLQDFRSACHGIIGLVSQERTLSV